MSKISKIVGVVSVGLLLTSLSALGGQLEKRRDHDPMFAIDWPQGFCTEAITFLLMPSGVKLPPTTTAAICP